MENFNYEKSPEGDEIYHEINQLGKLLRNLRQSIEMRDDILIESQGAALDLVQEITSLISQAERIENAVAPNDPNREFYSSQIDAMRQYAQLKRSIIDELAKLDQILDDEIVERQDFYISIKNSIKDLLGEQTN